LAHDRVFRQLLVSKNASVVDQRSWHRKKQLADHLRVRVVVSNSRGGKLEEAIIACIDNSASHCKIVSDCAVF